MGRTYHRDGFDLVQVDHPDAWEHDNPRAYQVIADGLGYVGTVGTYMETFERRPYEGARYVTSRWRSERWWYRLEGQRNEDRGQRGFEGPGRAAWMLIWEVQRGRGQA